MQGRRGVNARDFHCLPNPPDPYDNDVLLTLMMLLAKRVAVLCKPPLLLRFDQTQLALQLRQPRHSYPLGKLDRQQAPSSTIACFYDDARVLTTKTQSLKRFDV